MGITEQAMIKLTGKDDWEHQLMYTITLKKNIPKNHFS